MDDENGSIVNSTLYLAKVFYYKHTFMQVLLDFEGTQYIYLTQIDEAGIKQWLDSKVFIRSGYETMTRYPDTITVDKVSTIDANEHPPSPLDLYNFIISQDPRYSILKGNHCHSFASRIWNFLLEPKE